MSTSGRLENPPGVKRVTRPDGTVYLYAWRGRNAPRLYEPEGSEALRREWKEALKSWSRPVPTASGDVSSWLDEWSESGEFGRYAKRTQTTYRGYIAKIRAKFGTADPRAFEEKAMRPELLKWRDVLAEDGPAAADNCIAGLKTFLAWMQDRGVIGHHVAGRIKRLSHSDRADCIWTARHVALFREKAPAHLVLAMDVARLTALAAVDLVRLEWSMFDLDEIEIRRQKTGELALIPILDELREVLRDVPRAHERVILTSEGKPYDERSLSARFCEVTKRIGMPERTLHDLRRTAATEFCRAGLDDREVAEILGWRSQDVAQIRRRYVGRKAIIRRTVERLADHRAKAGKLAKEAA
jgi:integrase